MHMQEVVVLHLQFVHIYPVQHDYHVQSNMAHQQNHTNPEKIVILHILEQLTLLPVSDVQIHLINDL